MVHHGPVLGDIGTGGGGIAGQLVSWTAGQALLPPGSAQAALPPPSAPPALPPGPAAPLVIPPDIALSKGIHLLDFASHPKINALSYKEWFGSGLAIKPVGTDKFAYPFYRAGYRTGKIKFNLEDVDIGAALSMDERLARSIDPVNHPEIGGKDLITEWELRQVLQNQRLFDKTEFFFGPQVRFTAEEAGSMGLQFMPRMRRK